MTCSRSPWICFDLIWGIKTSWMILELNVDDLKGAGEEAYRLRLIKALEAKFEKLKVKLQTFECIGVMHEQDPRTKGIWAPQQHYVPQLHVIPVDSTPSPATKRRQTRT